MDKIEFNLEEYDNLKQLLDPKHPFLERFRDKAPGTFKHSQNVADLCETVALELDLNVTVMRILGMYHDCGKIAYPECFYENQNGSGNNLHNDLDPMTSFYLLTKHISDSALILVQLDGFPKELIIPITQHHGTTIMKTMANKAPNVEADMFRYKNTSCPTTLEAAILMICDSIDATIRSKENTERISIDGIRSIIMNTIERVESDDQLDEIRVGDLKKIKKALQKDLVSKYHNRSSSDYEEKD